MILDIIVAIIIVLAVIKGYRRGLIVGIFSLIAILVGLAAAIKLSAMVADKIGTHVNISQHWLPIISFFVVFIIVVLLVRLGANAVQRLAEAVFLGWINRVGGVILYIAIYLTIFSVVLFYAEQVKAIKPNVTKGSVTYNTIQPWGPKAINSFGTVVPAFKNMFGQLEDFFGGVSQRVAFRSSRN